MNASHIRRQVCDLGVDDLDHHPVWEFALDEEGEEGQDEATVRPCEMPGVIDPSTGTYILRARQHFNAVRLLLPQVQLVFARELGADYRFAIPCRDWAFCWSASQSMAWQEKNAAEAEEVYLSDDYSLSPDVYRMSGGRIEVCKPRSAPWPK